MFSCDQAPIWITRVLITDSLSQKSVSLFLNSFTAAFLKWKIPEDDMIMSWPYTNWASMRVNLSSWGGGGGGGVANNTGADQPAHECSLISTFVIRFLESIIYNLATGEILISS